MVLQHVAHEILGTLNPLLKSKGFRIRYVNFGRHPDSHPSLEKYNGLIVLGGPMSVNDTKGHGHLKTEMQLIEEALKKDIPILGICLGAQLVAHVLGASVRRAKEKELGWYNINLTDKGKADPVFKGFNSSEKVFQWHADTFEIPRGGLHLASSENCLGQAFRFGEKVYGMQFHLEVDQAMIHRRLRVRYIQEEMLESHGKFDAAQIESETAHHIQRSLALSSMAFEEFYNLFGLPDRPLVLDSGHGKPRRPTT
jgi:GMP synthase (glutamine-hydrolysing)